VFKTSNIHVIQNNYVIYLKFEVCENVFTQMFFLSFQCREIGSESHEDMLKILYELQKVGFITKPIYFC